MIEMEVESEKESIKKKLKQEVSRHKQTLEYHHRSIQEELLRHQRIQRELEEQLSALHIDGEDDDSYWVNNLPAALTTQQEEAKAQRPKLTSRQKGIIRNRVREWAERLRRRNRGAQR